MPHTTERQASPVQQPLRNAALRRNLGISAIIAVAFSGGPFGLTWLATSSTTTFLLLMVWRFWQQKVLH
jgi:hypothetical protein